MHPVSHFHHATKKTFREKVAHSHIQNYNPFFIWTKKLQSIQQMSKKQKWEQKVEKTSAKHKKQHKHKPYFPF